MDQLKPIMSSSNSPLAHILRPCCAPDFYKKQLCALCFCYHSKLFSCAAQWKASAFWSFDVDALFTHIWKIMTSWAANMIIAFEIVSKLPGRLLVLKIRKMLITLILPDISNCICRVLKEEHYTISLSFLWQPMSFVRLFSFEIRTKRVFCQALQVS